MQANKHTNSSSAKEHRALFNLPIELRETVLRIAEIRYEEERQSPYSGKDEQYFKKMKNRLICDYCDKITKHTSVEELQQLSQKKEEQLKHLKLLREGKIKTRFSTRTSQDYNRDR